MLLVPTYVAPSPIQGMGLFAAVDIPRGTTIWSFEPSVDWRLTPSELDAFPASLQEQLRKWCYEEGGGSYVLCGDNAKFMNHSFDPNCDDPEGVRTVTNRDVRAGEELTCDYRAIDAESARSGLEEWVEPVVVALEARRRVSGGR